MNINTDITEHEKNIEKLKECDEKLKFKRCLFGDQKDIKKNRTTPRFIRNIYEDFKKDVKDVGYPEMFDVTFDFVPRMCSKNLCDFCIFKENNKLSDLCTKDEKKFCPVILISCGYANKCKIEGCPVIDNCGKR